MRIEAKKSGQHAVTTVAEFHGFKAGVQAALLLVQAACALHDGMATFAEAAVSVAR